MQLVGGLLDVGDGHDDLVALVDLDGGGGDGGADFDHLHHDLVALAGHPRVFHVPDRQRVLVLLLGIDLDGMELVRLDHLGVVRLGLGEGVVEELHLLFTDVHELAGLGLRGAHREVSAMRQLVQAHEVLAVRRHRVALGRGEMADRIGHRHLVHHLPGPELPLRDRAVHEERRVGPVVGAELGVQRPEAHRHLCVLDGLVLEHRDAVLVAREVLVLDRGLDLLEVEDGGDALELARAHDPLAVRGHVDAVGRLAAGHEVGDAGHLLRVEDLDPADEVALALGGGLLRGLPVDGGDVVAVALRGGDLELPGRALRVVGGPEHPAVGGQLARIAEVVVEGGHQDLEAQRHQAALRIDLDGRDHALVVGCVLLDRGHRSLGDGDGEA